VRQRLFTALIVLAVASVFAIGGTSEARRISRLVLEPNTMAELTALLSAADALHASLTEQDDEQIDVILRDIEVATRRTMMMSAKLKPHDRSHLVKILESVEMNVGVARNSGHTDRRERIVDIFNMMANLVRIYGVDTRFKIFFCDRDKMTWIQTKASGQHPFADAREPASVRNCALRAP